MMRLFFDVGNTRLKWALDNGDQADGFEHVGQVSYKQKKWTELEQLLEFGQVESVWVSSVASTKVNTLLNDWVEKNYHFSPQWLMVQEFQCGVKNDYGALAQLGVDRWAAVLGANDYLINNGCIGETVIVVDAGTAVTVDVLTAESEFKGGAILPGLVMMHDALVGATQGISSSLASNLVLPGVNTKQCVNSGVHYGLCGGVERIVEELKVSLKLSSSDIMILLTGGDAVLIEEHSKMEVVLLPNLVIDGLRSAAKSSENR